VGEPRVLESGLLESGLLESGLLESRGPAESRGALGSLTLASKQAFLGKLRHDLGARHHAGVAGGVGKRAHLKDDLAEEIGLNSRGRLGFTDVLGHRTDIGIRPGAS